MNAKKIVLISAAILFGGVLYYSIKDSSNFATLDDPTSLELKYVPSTPQSPLPQNPSSNKLTSSAKSTQQMLTAEQLKGVEKIASVVRNSFDVTERKGKSLQAKGEQYKNALNQLDEKYTAESPAEILVNSSGDLTSIFPKYTTSFDTSSSDGFESAASTLLSEMNVVLSLGEDDEVISQKVKCFNTDSCSATFERRLHGYPVLNSAVVVSGDGGKINTISGVLTRPSIDASTLAALDKYPSAELETLAKTYLSNDAFQIEGEPQYGIYVVSGQAIPAYKFTVGNGPFEKYSLTLNANTSYFIEKESLIADATNSTGVDLRGNEYQFVSVLSGSQHLMIDNRFPEGARTVIRDANQLDFDSVYNNTSINIVSSTSQNSGWNASAVSALSHFDSLVTYFNQTLGYTVGSDLPKDMTMVVNINGLNAKAGDNYLLFGKTANADFANARDVVGHELTHSIIQGTSNLRYIGQSGALNESFADLFGSLAENKEQWWIIGEDISTSGATLRNLANPTLGNPAQPAHMNNYVYTSEDHGGVHSNSGIINRFFYLLIDGLTKEGLGTSIGKQDLSELAFSTMLALPPDASFAQFYSTIQAKAESSFGKDSSQTLAVSKAGSEVGLDIALEVDKSSTSQTEKPFSADDGNIGIYLYPNYLFGWYDVYLQAFNSTDRTANLDGSIQVGLNAQRKQPLATVLEGVSNFVILYMSNNGDLVELSQLDGEEYTGTALSAADFADLGLTLQSLSLSKDRSKLAMSFEELGSFIVYNFNTDEFTLITPSLTSYTENESIIDAKSIDSMRFDPTNRKIAFDFEVCTGDSQSDCYWSVGIYDFISGKSTYPFPSQSSDYLVGFPVFSNQSDNYMAIDIANKDSGESGVYIYDFSSNEMTPIAKTKLDEVIGVRFGNPSFNQDDSSLVFTAHFGNGADQSTLIGVELQDYKRLEGASSYPIVPDVAVFGRSEPFTVVDLVPSLNAEKTLLDYGYILADTSQDLCITNDGTFNITLNDFSIPENTGLNILGLDQVFEGGETRCSRFSLSYDELQLGAYSNTVSISHDGKNSPLLLSLTGTVDLDTDGDGIGNTVDEDDDGDNVADVNDAFPLDKNEQSDNDKDGIGDNADTDDDNDLMSDEFETTYGLDPKVNDSDGDLDGDGRSNYEEYVADSDPTKDDVAPVITLPSDIVVDSTGMYTIVDIGSATANDILDGSVSVSSDSSGKFRPGKNVVKWTAKDKSGNTATAEQSVSVLPIITLQPLINVGEGNEFALKFYLNGEAPSYPASFTISLSGSAAEGTDFSIPSNTISLFSPGELGLFRIQTLQDQIAEGAESFTISISAADGLAFDENAVSVVTIYDEPTEPKVVIDIAQDGAQVRAVSRAGGNVTITARIEDPNGSHSVDWTSSDNAVMSVAIIDGSTMTIDPKDLATGLYEVIAQVSDDQIADKTFKSIYGFKVSDQVTQDSDGDGIPDADDDFSQPNLSSLSSASSIERPVQASAGATLVLGSTALEKNGSGLAVNEDDISSQDESYNYPYGLVDFVAKMNVPGESLKIVIPLNTPLVSGLRLRKYSAASGWADFVTDENNAVNSANSSNGICPDVSSDNYQAGLSAGADCLQLVVQDGGANDADLSLNGVVVDPSGLAEVYTPPTTPSTPSGGGGVSNPSSSSGGGGCTVSDSNNDMGLIVLMLISLMGIFRRKLFNGVL